jgi:hypothetical protein
MKVQIILSHIALYNHPTTKITEVDSPTICALLYIYIEELTVKLYQYRVGYNILE